jgi:hypothetical protein
MWRESGYTVIVIEDITNIAEIAQALNVSGRGEALLAYMAQQ